MSALNVTDSHGSTTTYVVVVALPQGEREVKSCGSLVEAILFRFDCEAVCVRAGYKVPPMRVEPRAEVSR